MEIAALKLKVGSQHEAADKHLRALQEKKQKEIQKKKRNSPKNERQQSVHFKTL